MSQAQSALLGKPNTVVLIAEQEDQIVGFAQLHYDVRHALVPSPASVELERLYVHKPFTQLGIGKTLLRQAEAIAFLRGASTLWLTAWIGNTRALEFYTCQGYKDAGATMYRFEGEEHENRVFMKQVG